MKNATASTKIFLFLACTILLLFTSCAKEENIKDEAKNSTELNEEELFKFSKIITVNDGRGSTAEVEVFAKSQAILDLHDERNILLITTEDNLETEFRSETSDVLDDEQEIEVEKFENAANAVYLKILSRILKPSITGFRVEIDENDSARWSYLYQYGVNNIRGIWARYNRDSCSKESLKVKISVRSNSQTFYRKKADVKLERVGDEWSWTSNTAHDVYRMGYEFTRTCRGSRSMSYMWKT